MSKRYARAICFCMAGGVLAFLVLGQGVSRVAASSHSSSSILVESGISQILSMRLTNSRRVLQSEPLWPWWDWSSFLLGFAGYVIGGVGAVALLNPLTGQQNLLVPHPNRLLFHTAFAGVAGFVTAVMQAQQIVDSLWTGFAVLSLIKNIDPQTLDLHIDVLQNRPRRR